MFVDKSSHQSCQQGYSFLSESHFSTKNSDTSFEFCRLFSSGANFSFSSFSLPCSFFNTKCASLRADALILPTTSHMTCCQRQARTIVEKSIEGAGSVSQDGRRRHRLLQGRQKSPSQNSSASWALSSCSLITQTGHRRRLCLLKRHKTAELCLG